MTTRSYATFLWLLSLLFALRVAGQAVQYSFPQAYLPDFHSFQGSDIPYWLLLTAQLVILGLMICVSWRIQIGATRPRRALGTTLQWIGFAYLLFAATRLAVGLTYSAAPEWFRTWIPGIFHVVLALYVIVLARFHLQVRPEARRI